MARKKKIPVIIKTSQESKDKRVISSTRKAVKSLNKFKPSEVAKSLGISVQKWTAIKRKIESGKLYNPELRDLLTVQNKKIERKKNKKTGKEKNFKEKKSIPVKIKTRPESGRPSPKIDSPVTRGKLGEYYWTNETELKSKIPQARSIKTFSEYKQAREWWKGISGGSSYFVLSSRKNKKTGQTIYTVVDIRTEKERSTKKGKLNGEARARKIVLDNSGN